MKLKTIKSISLIILLSTFQLAFSQQSDFTCKNDAYNFLKTTIGTWSVLTKDRISIGNYEKNKGISTITNSIKDCGVKESFRGVFKNKPYAREVTITGLDSTKVEMITLDSEHSSFSFLSGSISNNSMTTYWYRNKDIKKVQSKYILTIINPENFEFSSYLSTDYGENWFLTHQRKYHKKE